MSSLLGILAWSNLPASLAHVDMMDLESQPIGLPGKVSTLRSLHGGLLTAAGHMLVIAMSFLSSLSQSIAIPFVSTDIPTLPIAYAVLPLKNLE
jgi:hypothetical protein